jgi:AraC-like DNA-binding protein
LGFNSLTSFTRAFSRSFDIAPSELRKYAPLVQPESTTQQRFT